MISGLSHLSVADARLGLTYPAVVQYPVADLSGDAATMEGAAGVMCGPYRFAATLDAPVAPGRHPLAVISHGGGGSHLLYRSISTYLATHGWIVVCLEHPADNRNDRSLVNTDVAAERRARHASLAMDTVLAHQALGSHVDVARVAAVGHSMGGLTALTMAGGQPWSQARVPLAVQHDARIRAVVLLAPATDWFLGPDALAGVRVPVLAYVAEHDPVTPPARVRAVLSTLPAGTPCEVREIAGAGHFSFLTPFPEALRRPDFPPSQDPPGFDRDALHRTLPGEIGAFLDATVR